MRLPALLLCTMVSLTTGLLHAQEPTAPAIGLTLGTLFRSPACNWTSPSLKQIHLPSAVRANLPLSDQDNRDGWTPVPSMSDEFNDSTLDLTRWQPRIDGWSGRQPALFVAENVAVADGRLMLKMAHQAVPANYQAAGYHDFTAAAVQSRKSVLYGYFEIRAKAMPSAGSSAFWLAGQTSRNWNEIDVFEIAARAPGDPHKIFMDAHVFRVNGREINQSLSGILPTNQNMSDGFHVFGLEWTADSIDTYLDGQHVRHICNTSWHMPLRIILDAETQPQWWGLPALSDLPSTYQIDYIRVWQRRSKTPE
jgi:beta-glucanase (GH16 family)